MAEREILWPPVVDEAFVNSPETRDLCERFSVIYNTEGGADWSDQMLLRRINKFLRAEGFIEARIRDKEMACIVYAHLGDENDW